MTRYNFVYFKYLLVILFISLMSQNCTQKSDLKNVKIEPLSIDSIPDIQFIGAFNINNSGKLYMSYSYSGGFGTQEFRSYTIDTSTNQLTYEKSYFKRDNNYRDIYDPIVLWDENNNMLAYERGNPLIYRVEGDSLLQTNDALLSVKAKVPRELVMDARQGFYKSPRQYYFIGRGPKDSYQAVYLANNQGDSTVVTETQKIIYDKKYPSWVVNYGKMVYNIDKNKAAFGFQLFPIIHIYDIEKQRYKEIITTKSSIDTSTFDEADIWSLNPVQFQFMTSSKKYLYALHWGIKYSEMEEAVKKHEAKCRIYKFDWNGNMICSYRIEKGLDAIAVSSDDQYIIGHTRDNKFYILTFEDAKK